MKQAEEVVRRVRAVLGGDLAGAYLHGSAVLGGGLRATSDVDVFAVVRRSTSHAERRALTAGLMEISGGAARPVELTAVVGSEIRPWRYPPRREYQYGEWLRAEYERGLVPTPRPDPDLAPLITVVLRGNAPLHGPPPGELLDPVPPADLRRGMVAGVPELLAELKDDTRNVVLTLVRIWTTLETGEIRAKDAAADWALPRLPALHRPVLAHARAVYRGEAREHWEGLRDQVHRFGDHMAGVINLLT